MPNTNVPAAGEAMPAAYLHRRAMITGTAATAAALAASTLPAEPAEHPCERARHLAGELSLAMEGWCAELDGLWAATVCPAFASRPIAFDNLDARSTSPIIELFQQWDALYVEGYVSPASDDNDECSRIVLAMKELEHKIAALPALTARDLAAKLIALSTFGEYGLDHYQTSVFADARALIGRAAL